MAGGLRSIAGGGRMTGIKGNPVPGRIGKWQSMPVAADNERHGLEPCRRRMTFDVGFKTHIGLGRHANEDTFWVSSDAFARDRVTRLIAVADGMGGHKGGTIASRFACDALKGEYARLVQSNRQSNPEQLCRALTDSIYRIDRGLRYKACKTEDMQDMGTTLSCLVLTDRHSIIGHVGDSRIYRWRSGHLSCLTKDHTFVQEMITEGEIDPTTAHKHPLRHLLTQAVGTAEPLEHVLARVDRLKPGDRFLLCTDGLHNCLPKERICELMAVDGDAGSLAANLVDSALANRTRDNVTALVVMVARIGERTFARVE